MKTVRHALVPSTPGPPYHPNNFCAPCPASSPPTTTRVINKPRSFTT